MQRFEKALAALGRRNRLRRLAPRSGLDFTSNDYLALADSPELAGAIEEALQRGVPVGAGGSRLLRGNHPEHEALEAEAAAFFRCERALYFGGGFWANYAVLSLLPDRGDLVVHDALIHASCHEGLRASEATVVSVPHNDAAAFDDAIRRWRRESGGGRAWIVVESLYSMDGDRAPLAELAQIAERHEAILYVDEAHATGVCGPDGRGLAASLEGGANVLCLHTCGKALGAMGALVCGPAAVADFLINRSRPFIYATAPSPLMAAAVRAALGLVANDPSRRARHARLVELANREIATRCDVPPSGSHILPVVVGTSARALEVAAAVQALGYDVRAIRPPTVPDGTARLRVSITLHADEAAIAALAAALAQALHAPVRA